MARRFRCPRPVNRLVLRRKPGFSGPFAQNIGGGICMHTPGNHIGSGGGTPPSPVPTLAFHAATMDPATGEMLPIAMGDGPMTVGRDTDIWLKDYEGWYQQFGAGEVGWQGGRVTGPVGSRVVYGTDEQGDPLPEMPFIVSAPQATNECTDSTQFDGTAWSEKSAGLTLVQDQIDIAERSNTAWTVSDTSGAAIEYLLYSGSKPVSSAPRSACVWIGVTSGASSFPGIALRGVGVASHSSGIAVNTNDGTWLQRDAQFSPVEVSVDREKDTWRVTMTIEDLNGNNAEQLYVHPAVCTGSLSSTWSAASIGSCMLSTVCIFPDAPHAAARTLSPIFTAGAEVMRSADINTVPTSNHDETNAAIYCEMVSGLGSALTGTDNDLIVGNPAVNTQRCLRRTRHAIASATTGTAAESITGDMDNGDINKVGLVYDNATGKMQVCVNGTWGVEVSDYVGVPITVYQILGNIAGVAATNQIRNLREYRGTYDELQAIIDGLMA